MQIIVREPKAALGNNGASLLTNDTQIEPIPINVNNGSKLFDNAYVSPQLQVK